jgi:drug/metabolite transporter (DMT)-like permease
LVLPTLIAFLSFIVLSGGAAIAIRFTYAELPTFWSAASRFGLAAIVFWLLVVLLRIELPRGRALLGAALFGVLSFGSAFIFIYWGLEKTPASLYQIIAAVVPLLTLFFASLHGLEKIRLRSLFGASLAVVGIAVAFGGSLDGEVSIWRLVAILAGSVCFAEAGVVAKQFPNSHPIATSAVALTAGTPIVAATALLAGEVWILPSSAGTWWAFGYLVVGASVAAFLFYLHVLRSWTASATSYGFVLIPLVTVALATSLAGERITGLFVVGGVLVLAGVWVGALKKGGARVATVEARAATEPARVGSSSGDA